MSRLCYYDPKCGFVPYPDVPEEKPPMTNADRIRQMEDEELAIWIDRHWGDPMWCDNERDCDPNTDVCADCICHWLQFPYKEEVDDGTG